MPMRAPWRWGMPWLFATTLVAGCRCGEPALAEHVSDAAVSATPPVREDVRFRSGPHELRGLVMVPSGPGRFPVVVYNHGSERDPSPEFFGELGEWFRERGYVAFFPYRRGASRSEGPHWEDEVASLRGEARERAIVTALEAQSDDVLAAIAWVRSQPYADARRVSVAGCSFGGIETVLAAERSRDLVAAVDFAGASISWAGSPTLRERMRVAVRNARAPIFFVQAENDFDTTPSRVLASEMNDAGKAHAMRIFPPHGKTPMAGHAHFCNHGMREWGDDVLAFMRR